MTQTAVYAARYKVWPPEGYTEPTEEEITALRGKIERFRESTLTRAGRDKIPGQVLLRHAQLMEIIPRRGITGKIIRESDVYAYAGWVRKECNRRKIKFVSVKLHRCAMCSHGTERVWEATPETHTITDKSGDPWTGFLCTACWSEYRKDDSEDGEE